jgi:hypothetical protein
MTKARVIVSDDLPPGQIKESALQIFSAAVAKLHREQADQ